MGCPHAPIGQLRPGDREPMGWSSHGIRHMTMAQYGAKVGTQSSKPLILPINHKNVKVMGN